MIMQITIFKNSNDEVVDFADGHNYYTRIGCDSVILGIPDADFDTLQAKHKERKVKFKNNKLKFE